MKQILFQLIAFAITGFLFMNMSVTFGWSKRLWSLLNKKLDSNYNFVQWIIFAGIITIIIHFVCNAFKITNIKLIKGIVLGIYLAAMPNLDKISGSD